MTVATRTDALTADIRQLTRPIHIAHRGRIHALPPLLDQLRDACNPTRSTTHGGTRTAPCSRPPARLDAIDALTEVYVGISMCHARLNLPSPPRNADWQKGALRLMADRAHDLTPELVDWLALEVNHWWKLAAVTAGWRPEQLLRLR
jgi:hypothetical protein